MPSSSYIDDSMLKAATVHPENISEESIDSESTKIRLITPVQKIKAYANYFLRNIKLLFLCFGIYIVFNVAVTLILFEIANDSAAESRHTTNAVIGTAIECDIYNALMRATSQLPSLALTATAIPDCAEIVSLFPMLAQVSMDPRESPVRLYFDAAGIVTAAYPLIVGYDMFHLDENIIVKNDSDYHHAMARKTDITMSLPFHHPHGYLASYAQLPVWKSADNAFDDVGCDAYYNCTADCWDRENSMKFLGMFRALLDLDDIFTSSMNGIRIWFSDYDMCLYSRRAFSDESFILLYCSPDLPKQPVTRTFTVYGLDFRVKLTKKVEFSARFNDPWAPDWKYRLTFAVYILSFPFTFLIYWAVVSLEKYSRLLSTILPQRVIDHLAIHTGVFSEQFSDITILFSDICNFTPLAAMLTPIQIVGMLDELYSLYDELAKKHGVYKVETIGDAYMVSCGCPDKIDPKIAAAKMVAMAKDMLKTARSFHPSYLPEGVRFSVRVGINSGGVVAGVVGRAMPRYCLFGDVVNTASRMESTCEPMQIQISENTKVLLDGSDVEVFGRGFVEVKGKGSMKTYYVNLGADLNTEIPSVPLSMPPSKSRNVAFTWIERKDKSESGSNKSSFFNSLNSLTPARSRHRSQTNESDSNTGIMTSSIEDRMRQGFRSLTELPSRLSGVNSPGRCATDDADFKSGDWSPEKSQRERGGSWDLAPSWRSREASGAPTSNTSPLLLPSPIKRQNLVKDASKLIDFDDEQNKNV